MPLHIQKRKGKFCVVDPAGKQFGCHPTKQKAIDQIAAIEMSKKQRGKSMEQEIELGNGVKLIANDRIKALSAEIQSQANDSNAPPIAIISDGTADGTVLMIHGQVVPFSSMDLYCSKGDYTSCSMSVTVRETGADGIEVSKTMSLRKTEDKTSY